MNSSIDKLKAKIVAKECIVNGTLAKQYKQCGKANCRCRKEKDLWHGPYWIWTRKVNGKTKTKTLSKEQAVVVKKAIREMKELNQLIEKWRAQSVKEIVKM